MVMSNNDEEVCNAKALVLLLLSTNIVKDCTVKDCKILESSSSLKHTTSFNMLFLFIWWVMCANTTVVAVFCIGSG